MDNSTDIVARLRNPSAGSPRWATTMEEAADEIMRLRRGWLTVIQGENSCPATGGGCLAKRCGCVAEMEMLMQEANSE